MIKLLVMDVDGTLTDGKVYMGNEGEVFKAFDIKDGCGIKLLLPQHGITPAIITARESAILQKRCAEIGIAELHQNCFEKQTRLKEILSRLGISAGEVAYVGDDIPDLPCMAMVQEAGGLVMAPADAIPEIKSMADYVSGYHAGSGAIRDCIQYLIRGSFPDKTRKVQSVIDWILNGDFEDKAEGRFPDGSFYTIQEYCTKEEEHCIIETHRNHIDIQYLLSGSEILKTFIPNSLVGNRNYNEEKDVEIWRYGTVMTSTIMLPRSLMVIYDGQPHMGAIINGKSEKVKKLVCKVSSL